MTFIPDWIRTEVYHALSVHFPIAFLLLATFLMIGSLFPFRPHYFSNSGSLLLSIGVIMAWIAIYTGDLADGIVSRSLCDPTILKDHENAAYALAYIFSGAAILDIAVAVGFIKGFRRWVRILIVVLMLVGSGFLVYSGDLGASLVYQQAGGVNVPSENCAEFE